jgi:hypothetical protein
MNFPQGASFSGLRVVWTDAAVEKVVTVAPFNPSRHRSARITKKLIKRNTRITYKPACFRVGSTLLMHPAMRPELERHLKGDAS